MLDGVVRPGVLDGSNVVDLSAAGLPVDATGDLMCIVRGGDALLDSVRRSTAATVANIRLTR
jgi:hypothetical protein